MLAVSRILLPVLLAGMLAACHRGEEPAVRVAMIGDAATPFVTGPRLPPAAQALRAATAEGLVGFDAEGHVVPALADRWIVTDDGRTYIFRLRPGAWGNGINPGEPARTALRQAVASLAGTPLGLDLAGIDEIRVMAGRVLEIRLSRPIPDLLLLLAQPELGLVRRGQASSPMALRRTGTVALLTPLPPEKRGLPALDGWADHARPLHLVATDSARALADFAAGRADLVLGGTFVDLPRVSRLALGRSRPRFDPVTGLFGLQVARATGVLATPAGREAVAKAIDRDALAAALAIPGWISTTRVIPPGTEGDAGLVDERWPGQSIAARQAAAAQVVTGWARGRQSGATTLAVALPAGPGADILFTRLKADLATIGLRLERVAANAPADLRLLDAVARSARPGWFLDQLSCEAGRGPCSETADLLATRAAIAADPAAAADLAAQAEAALTVANTFIPLGLPVRWSLVANDTPGFATNRRGIHPLFALATGGN